MRASCTAACSVAVGNRATVQDARGEPPQGHGEPLSGGKVTHDLPRSHLPPLSASPTTARRYTPAAPPRLGRPPRPPVAIRIIPHVVVGCLHLRAARKGPPPFFPQRRTPVCAEAVERGSRGRPTIVAAMVGVDDSEQRLLVHGFTYRSLLRFR